MIKTSLTSEWRVQSRFIAFDSQPFCRRDLILLLLTHRKKDRSKSKEYVCRTVDKNVQNKEMYDSYEIVLILQLSAPSLYVWKEEEVKRDIKGA